MLRLGNDEFYEYAYFERTLEWLVRDYLINDIFYDLFAIHGIKSKSMRPDNRNYAGYNTESIENIFSFEFIFAFGGEKIGVRYTGLCAGEAEKLIEKYRINRIIQIEWSADLTNRDTEQNQYDIVTPKNFFEQYFTLEEYEIFIEEVMKAIKDANDEIGLETIPRLSLRNLSSFKADINMTLSNPNPVYERWRFQVLPGSSDKKQLDRMSFDAQDYKILNNNFLQKGLYKALLGTEGFAKCFITAEYQYQIFEQGHKLDYTSVACGYLKAVEQLVYKLLQINLSYPLGDKLWIKKKNGNIVPPDKSLQNVTVRPNPITKSQQVIFSKDFERYFDIALTPMIWFLYDNTNGWEISDSGRSITRDFLLNFAKECRNDHFHKDNIDEFSVVSRIRNNAILIFYLLLGGYKLTGNHQKDLEILGIIDDSFDRLYKKVQALPRVMRKFIVYFSDEKPIKAYRHFTQKLTTYDKNGSVALSNIRFVAVDEFSNDEYDKAMQGEYAAKEFSLRKDNVPAKISYINGKNEEIFIDW